MKNLKILLIITGGLIASYFLFVCYLNCMSYTEKKIGEIQICNSDLKIVLYKTPDFNHNIPIHYQLYKKDSLLVNNQFLIGTANFDIELKDFITICQDSLFMLSIFDLEQTILTLNVNHPVEEMH